jgi:hypothetical protein
VQDGEYLSVILLLFEHKEFFFFLIRPGIRTELVEAVE